MIRILSVVFFLFFISAIQAQNSCSTAEFIRETKIKSTTTPGESWYKFRSKGALLTFKGQLGNDSLLEYEIYADGNCDQITPGYITPLRSTVKGFEAMTDELWEMVVNEGRCVCGTCLSKINLNYNRALKVNQGNLYLLKIISHGKPFTFELKYDKVDKLNPIQFDMDSVDLSLIEVGMVYQMKELFFIPATPNFLRRSFAELDRLKLFLAKNEVLKVEVRGHVNGPMQANLEFYQQLSDDRATAVKNFLVHNGVKEDRISIRGMSNKEMRYASPKNEFEAIENRRVEIVITTVK
jgi:hypothetical protein